MLLLIFNIKHLEKTNMKKVFKYAFVAAFVVMAGYGVYKNQKGNNLSDLALNNIEALAGDESSGNGTLYGNAEGTRYCCCPGGSRSCGASDCSNC